MSAVTVTHLGGREFEVVVPAASTLHVVRVDDATLGALGWEAPGEADLRRLVAASFDFLLEREPATSILRRFDLGVIESYFPGYISDIRVRLG